MEEKKFSFGKLYNLSQTELLILRNYLKKHLKKDLLFHQYCQPKHLSFLSKKKNDEL